jgi:hypothetical protein
MIRLPSQFRSDVCLRPPGGTLQRHLAAVLGVVFLPIDAMLLAHVPNVMH